MIKSLSYELITILQILGIMIKTKNRFQVDFVFILFSSDFTKVAKLSCSCIAQKKSKLLWTLCLVGCRSNLYIREYFYCTIKINYTNWHFNPIQMMHHVAIETLEFFLLVITSLYVLMNSFIKRKDFV